MEQEELVRFERLDLNLLVALDALLGERHVSRAARRVNLTQSAMSAALRRLRDYFADDLLVMRGGMMALTPRAVELAAPVSAVLEQIEIRIGRSTQLDVEAERSGLSIMAGEDVVALLLPCLLSHLEKWAPKLRLDILPLSESPAQEIESRVVELAILAGNALAARHPSIELFTDDHAIVGCERNPLLRSSLTERSYLEMGHVTVFGDTGAEGALPHRIRIARRREVVVPCALALPAFLAGTQRVALLPRRLAQHLAARAPLALQDVPFPVTPMRLMAQWHCRQGDDPILSIVTEGLKASARSLCHRPLATME